MEEMCVCGEGRGKKESIPLQIHVELALNLTGPNDGTSNLKHHAIKQVVLNAYLTGSCEQDASILEAGLSAATFS
jgi:hypothetical protein